MFVVSAIQISLWLGAWYDPFGLVAHLESLRFHPDGSVHWSYMIAANAAAAAVFIAKTAALVFFQMWLRWTLPRLRIDQVLHLCIKVLLPLACFNLLGAAATLWLIDPLPRVQLTLQISLAALSTLLLLALFAVVLHAFLTRNRSTFKVLFPPSRPLPDLPGS
jgi:NADH:ubiquinone oxidoreductase subunit H